MSDNCAHSDVAPPPALAAPLTGREQAVLSLLRKSMSVSEIARELYLSGNTVKTHRRAIYRKLGVTTREEAIERTPELRAEQHGIRAG